MYKIVYTLYEPVKSGEKLIIQNVPLWLPRPGTCYNHLTGEYEKTEILFEKNKKADQYWRREELPQWWRQKREQERARQRRDPDYFDIDCEDWRKRQWFHRLNGCWFMNNGTPTYITGLHWFYLSHWKINGSYLSYRLYDRDKSYILKYSQENPLSLGIVEVTKKKSGKSTYAGAFIYEGVSRTSNCLGGIQSKNELDARNLYKKYVLQPYRSLPDYFQPVVDTTSGLTNGMRFFAPFAKGKKLMESLEQDELASQITYEDAGVAAYTTELLSFYVGDEEGKTGSVDVEERHTEVSANMELDGEIFGSCIHTSTVEDMGNKSIHFSNLYRESDQSKIDLEQGEMTSTKLLQIFTPAYETLYIDKYGEPDRPKAKDYYLTNRKKLQHSQDRLWSYIRKNPFTKEEAFRIESEFCLFDIVVLNTAMDKVSWQDQSIVRTGNYEWVEKDREVKFLERQDGRCSIVWTPEHKEANHVLGYNNCFRPTNGSLGVLGTDPVDNKKPRDGGRMSIPAGMLKLKHSSVNANKFYDDAFVLQYLYRPVNPYDYYEDMIKICFYHSMPMFAEVNKSKIVDHFQARGYDGFLLYLPGKDTPGISAGTKTPEEIYNLWAEYIMLNPDKLFFRELIDQLFKFDVEDTRKSDAVMAGGYALMAQKIFAPRPRDQVQKKSLGISKSILLRKHKFAKSY